MVAGNPLAMAQHSSLAFAIAASEGRFQAYAHQVKLARAIQAALADDSPYDGVIGAMPPRHGKSLYGSKSVPPWYLGNHPSRSVLACSYGQSLATEFGRHVRNLMASELYQEIFPGVTLSGDSQASHRFNVLVDGKDLGGGYYAAGVGGPITGRGADLGVIDDYFKNDADAFSKHKRDLLWNWYLYTFCTRLTKRGKQLIISTRWHDDDLVGRILNGKNAKKFLQVILPAISPEGHALCPELMPLERLLEIKEGRGGEHEGPFNALYQQDPKPAEGGVIKRAWWRYHRERPADLRVVQFWDCAQKPGITNDYSVCATWGWSQNQMYVLDVFRSKMAAPDLERAAKQQYAKHIQADLFVEAVVIEDASAGSSLIQYLQRNTNIPVLPVLARGDKTVRALAAAPAIEAGRVSLPDDAQWVAEFVDEHERFPSGAHDDQVDTTSMAVRHFQVPQSQPEMRVL